jgi:hypothetical protein
VDFEGPKRTLPLHQQANEEHAMISFEGVVGALLRENSNQEERDLAMSCLAVYGNKYGGDVLTRADLVSIMAATPEGLNALKNIVDGAELGDKEVKSLKAAIQELMAAARRADKDYHSAYLATSILAALLKAESKAVSLLDVTVFERARDVGTHKYAKLANAASKMLVDIECAL